MNPLRTRSVGRTVVTSLCKSVRLAVRSPKFWFCVTMWLYLSSMLLLSLTVTADQRVRPHVQCAHARDCRDVPRTTCRAGLCACMHRLQYYTMEPKGCYHPEERYDAIQQLHKYDRDEKMACAVDADCAHVPDASCVQSQCRCPSGQQYFELPEAGCYTADERKLMLSKQVTRLNKERAKMDKGETYINDNSVYLSNQPPKIRCTNDSDCSDFEYSVCSNRTCTCKKGDLFYGWGENIGCYGVDRPTPTLPRRKRSVEPRRLEQVGEEECKDNIACTVENSACHPKHKVCTCLRGFARTGSGECHPVEFGSACPTDGSDDGFCRRFLTRSVCVYGKCGCPEIFPIKGSSYNGHPACLSKEFEQTVKEISQYRSRLGDAYQSHHRPGLGRAEPWDS